MNDIALAKAQLRQEILLARKQALLSDRDNQELCRNIVSLVERHSFSRVAIYISYPTEPDTSLAIAELAARGVTVLLPETLPDGLLSWHELATGKPVTLADSDLLLIPALAVDLSGNRLGRGKGYFDRELEKLNTRNVFAVVFESEVLGSIPVEAHDQKVSGVVTQATIRDLN